MDNKEKVDSLIAAARMALSFINSYKAEHPDWPALENAHDEIEEAIAKAETIEW